MKGCVSGQCWRPQSSAPQGTLERVECRTPPSIIPHIDLPVSSPPGWESPRGVNAPHSELHLGCTAETGKWGGEGM